MSNQTPMQTHIMKKLERTAEALRANRMDAQIVQTKEEACEAVRALLKDGALVAAGGSMTLAESGVLAMVRDGNYQYLNRETVAPEEIPALYRKAFSADAYLMSSNAITENGELYNVDGNGNRVAALIYGPQTVIVVAGVNKIVPDLDAAVQRMKTIAAPVNAMRLNCETPCAQTGKCAGCNVGTDSAAMTAGCRSPQRICASYVVSAYQRVPNRIKVILVAENLGY